MWDLLIDRKLQLSIYPTTDWADELMGWTADEMIAY